MTNPIDALPLHVKFDEFVRGMHRSLTEFGYTSLTRETVADETLALLNGKKPKTVIGLLIQGEIEKHRLQVEAPQ